MVAPTAAPPKQRWAPTLVDKAGKSPAGKTPTTGGESPHRGTARAVKRGWPPSGGACPVDAICRP